MKFGNWVPVSNAFSRYLPSGRPYTKLEAIYSLQLDYDSGNRVTVSGYAALWQWSRGKVERFLDEIGVSIQYPESTDRKQNQNGQIMIQITSRSRAENGQIRLIDNRGLDDEASRSHAENGQKTSRSQSTTIDTNTDTDKNNVPFPEIITHLNAKSGKAFRPNSKKTRSLIIARFNEGFSLEDFIKVINHKTTTWGNDPKMCAYLRPETLFGPKFESYLNENGSRPAPQQPVAEVHEFDFSNQFKNG